MHPDAELEVIQAAYRRLAQKYHPDVGQNDGRRMQALNEAYAVLSDPQQRSAYEARYGAGGAETDTCTHKAGSSLPLWRILLPTILSLAVLVLLILDMVRLGVRRTARDHVAGRGLGLADLPLFGVEAIAASGPTSSCKQNEQLWLTSMARLSGREDSTFRPHRSRTVRATGLRYAPE